MLNVECCFMSSSKIHGLEVAEAYYSISNLDDLQAAVINTHLPQEVEIHIQSPLQSTENVSSPAVIASRHEESLNNLKSSFKAASSVDWNNVNFSESDFAQFQGQISVYT